MSRELMMRALMAILACLSAGSAVASDLSADQSGREKYLVMGKKHLFMQPNASAPPPLVGDEEIGRLGGAVEYRGHDRLVVSLPPAAVEAVRRHEGVKYLQRAVKGRQPVVTPADTGRRPGSASNVGQATHALRPVGQATWDSGVYQYDGAGNITNIGSSVYVYDPLMRLVRADIGSNSETYGYDSFGNLTQRGSLSIPVSLSNNRLVGGIYDPAGNLTEYGFQTHAYDPFNMMRQSSSQGPEPDLYVYTASDERIGVRNGMYWLWSFRDGSGKVIRQYESLDNAHFATWRWVEDYVYRDGLLLGGERVPEEGGRRHFHLDHLGTPRLITGANGLTVSKHDYFPFGNEITPLCQEVCNGFDREEPMRFTGHERDSGGGTIFRDYMHARSTNPSLGRFLSVDPLISKAAMRRPQLWNRYAYVGNNPINFVDPTGKLLQVHGSECSDGKKDCYTRLQAFDALKSYVGKDAAKYLQMGKNGLVTLNGISAFGFAKLGFAASQVGAMIRHTGATGHFALSNDAATLAAGGARSDPVAGGMYVRVAPSSLPSMSGGVFQTMDTAMAHELGHAVQGMYNIPLNSPGFGRIDPRYGNIRYGVRPSEGFAVWSENRYRAEQGLDPRSYYWFGPEGPFGEDYVPPSP